MSEQKRDTLTSIGTNKKEKKSKSSLKTVRFTLGLAESNEEACPEFNYSALLISAEKKRKVKPKSDGQVNGIDPLAEEEDEDEDEAEEDEDDEDYEENNNEEGEEADADDDDDDEEEEDEEEDDDDEDDVEDIDEDADNKLKEIARHFEEKYGGKKKHGRYEDYVDLGAGYDETDPFIDNTDAYDEVVPEEMTTAHGGFYINCGALEFKEVSDQSDAEEIKDSKSRKHIKRMATISEEDGENADEKVGNNHELKKPKLEENDHKEEALKKKKLHSHDREILKKKKKRAIDDLLKKKPVTVKELLKEKREMMEIETTPDAQVPLDQKKPAAVPKTNNTSITDVIESVVSAAHEDETSKDSGSSVSKSDSEESQDAEMKEKTAPTEETLLPDNLQDDLKELLLALKTRAMESSTGGKCKFFNSDVNSMLLRVEHKCRTLTCSNRQAVYGYLASYLPCTKDTLMKRAKKLLIKDEEDKLQEPLKKLKSAIDRIMPLVLENYSKECQRVAEEKSVEELPSPPSEGEGDKQSVQKSKVPRRKFPWSEETRNLLCEVVLIKMQCVELVKPRKESADLYLRNFLEKEVKPLWPPGWMKVSTLLRESSRVHANIVVKPKKTGAAKKTTAAVPSPMGAIQSVTALSQTSTASLKMKPAPPSVSISLTPVSSTPQIPNTAKMKPVYAPDSSIVYPHVSTSVTVRTKCPTNLPAPVSSNMRSSPISTNANRLPGVQLVPTPSVPSRKKTVGEVTIAKVPSSSGKSSPSFQPERQALPTASLKPKMNLGRVSPKSLDLSSSSVNRSVLVNNVPDNSFKAKSSCEVNSMSDSVQKTMLLTNLPLMNIPDCISVTPSLPSPSQAVVTSTVSPPVTSTPKSMMSLKQRILHDTSLDLCKPINLKSDDSIEVIQIVKENRSSDSVVSKLQTKSENVTPAKIEPRKKKKNEILKDSVATSVITSIDKTPVIDMPPVCVSSMCSVVTTSYSSGNTTSISTTTTTTVTTITSVSAPVTTTTTATSVINPPTIALQLEKEVERLLKENDEEETAAAADFLSQINESLKEFSNPPPNISNRDIYQNEERVERCDQESVHSLSPRVESSPSVSSPSLENKLNPSVIVEEKDRQNNSKVIDLKKKVDQADTPQDDEESVQMEVDRVMKELRELQGQFNAEKSLVIPELDYSPTKTIIPKVSTNCSSLPVTVTHPVQTQQPKISKLHSENPVMSGVGRHPSAGSTEMAKMTYGFQDEFQKHLFQETMGKQVEIDVSNSCKTARSKSSSAYPQTVQKQSQNSSLEGCVTGSQSRSRSDTNPAMFYPKLLRENMESFSVPAFLGRIPTNYNSGISHLQDFKSNAHIPQSGSSQHSPPF